MTSIVFLISLLLGVSKNLIPKCSREKFSAMQNVMTANIITSILALLIFGVQGLNVSAFWDVRFVLMAALYGLFTLGSQTLYIKAVKDGPVSICSMIYAFCFLVPTIIMAIYFKERISFLWIVGIVLMLSAVMLVVFKGDAKKNDSKKYLVFIFGAMISAGMVGMLQKFFGHIYGQNLFNEYIFLSFAFMLVYSVFGKIITSQKKSEEKNNKLFYLLCIFLALSNVVASRLNLYLSVALPATIFFPSINGATIFLSSICSRLFFKERLNPLGWIGIFVGIGAIVMIAI